MCDLQGTEHVEIIGDDTDRSVLLPHKLLAVDDVLHSGFRLGLLDDAVFRNPMLLQIVGHALRFGERLVMALTAGNDADGIRIFLQIIAGSVQPIAQRFAGA